METKTPKILTRIIPLLFITVNILHAVELADLNDTSPQITYSNMSTKQLQKEVERLSQNGDVPFPIGMELIRRWTNNNITITNY